MFDRPVQGDLDIEQYLDDHHDVFAVGARRDGLRWCEEAVFAEAYDEFRWSVPETRENSWTVRDALRAAEADQAAQGPRRGRITKPGAGDIQLGQVHRKGREQVALILGGAYLYRTGNESFSWKGREYQMGDYRSREILLPDDQMWGWFAQRRIVLFKLGADAPADHRRVVFGTKDDEYTAFPEKHGFMGRRAIAREESWQLKNEEYEARLAARNPRRGQFGGKNLLGVSQQQKRNRWDEINEESGLRVKHAPSILMKNRYIVDQDSFIATYLSGSRGTGGTDGRARPDHVTDHEIYRMFTGKHRKRILDNTLFGGRDLQIVQVGKRKNNWWNKNQINRWWRIHNQN